MENANKQNLYTLYNTNDRYGDEGPHQVRASTVNAAKTKLAHDLIFLFRQWSIELWQKHLELDPDTILTESLFVSTSIETMIDDFKNSLTTDY